MDKRPLTVKERIRINGVRWRNGDPVPDGFFFGEIWIHDPTEDETGRWPVTPEDYYGEAYEEWAAKEVFAK